jgi:hypothetical protein
VSVNGERSHCSRSVARVEASYNTGRRDEDSSGPHESISLFSSFFPNHSCMVSGDKQ